MHRASTQASPASPRDNRSMSKDSPTTFGGRLWPSPLLLLSLLLLLPASYMVVITVSPAQATPIAIGVYVIIAGSLVLMSPTVNVRDGVLTAGNAQVDVSMLGKMRTLDDATLRRVIGPSADARAYLVVRGHIHRGVQIEIADEQDPTPYWVITTRNPNELLKAIERAKQPR